MKDKKLIHVATLGQPQGLRGEIKINIHTSSLDSFKHLNYFFMEDGISKIVFQSLKEVGKKYVSHVLGCEDRNMAETYKGKKIYCFRESLPNTKENEYYVSDLVGCKVMNIEKKVLGKIIDIKNFGAGDLMEIRKEDNNTLLIPMNEDNLININLHTLVIIVNPMKGLLD